MKNLSKEIAVIAAIAVLLFTAGCGPADEGEPDTVNADLIGFAPANAAAQITPEAAIPDLQAPLLDDRYRTTNSPLAQIDFRNFTYPLPRGWQHPDGSDLVLSDGRLLPVSEDLTDEMSDEERAARRAARRIGMSHVTTKFLDATGDGIDEAVVILKVETTGAAIPQLVYIFEWKDDKPELIWYFRTGDRADSGLKDIRLENGEFIIELFGQDRFLLGETETGKITGDEEQLCCPIFFTRTAYKWNGSQFILGSKRFTLPVNDPDAEPVENMGDIINAREKARK